MPDNYSEEELLELARKYSFRSRMDRNGVTGPIFVWGRGSVVRDINGKEYLDFNSGQMCAALGHNHPRIVQALQESAETLIHSHMTMLNDREIILAARLAEITPDGLNRSMFLGSGSDSNEAAMAIAKRYTGGYEVASPVVSFHGMSDAPGRSPSRAGARDMAPSRRATTRSSRPTATAAPSARTRGRATTPAWIPASSCWTRRPTGAWPPSSPNRYSAPAASSSRPRAGCRS